MIGDIQYGKYIVFFTKKCFVLALIKYFVIMYGIIQGVYGPPLNFIRY